MSAALVGCAVVLTIIIIVITSTVVSVISWSDRRPGVVSAVVAVVTAGVTITSPAPAAGAPVLARSASIILPDVGRIAIVGLKPLPF